MGLPPTAPTRSPAATPRPVIQITDTMTKAMAILSGTQTGLSTRELAAKILEADGIRVTVVKRHITYNRLRHSLAIYERAGVVKNINPNTRARRNGSWQSRAGPAHPTYSRRSTGQQIAKQTLWIGGRMRSRGNEIDAISTQMLTASSSAS